MDRRGFLRWLGGTAAGAVAAHTLDVDKLLWVPGAKKIFIPPAPKFCERCGRVHSSESAEDMIDRYVKSAAKQMADEWDKRAMEFVFQNWKTA